MKLEISKQIFVKFSNFNFHENPSSGRRVVSCGQMDKRRSMTKLILGFRNFAKAHKRSEEKKPQKTGKHKSILKTKIKN